MGMGDRIRDMSTALTRKTFLVVLSGLCFGLFLISGELSTLSGEERFSNLQSRELTLDRVIETALKQSGERRMKLLEQIGKQYAVDEAKGKMFPTVDFQATGSYMLNPPEGVVLPKGAMGYEPNQYSESPVPFPEQDYPMMEDPEHTYFKFEAGIQQPLYTWGKLKTGLSLAKKDFQLSRLETEKTEQYLIMHVRQLYNTLLFAVYALDTMEHVDELLEQIVRDREEEYRENLINFETVLEAQKNRAVIQTKVAEIKESYVQAVEGLFLVSGIDARHYTLNGTLNSPVKKIDDPEGLVRSAVSNAPDIKILSAKEELAGLYSVLENKTGQLRPDFFFSIGMDITGEQIPVVQPNWIETWDANLTFTLGTQIVLWDSGQSAAKRKQAAISERIANEGLRQTISKMEMTIRRLIEKHTVSYHRVKEYEAKNRFLEEQRKNAKVSFENDLITRTELLGSEIIVLQNEIEYYAALLTYHNTWAELAAESGKKYPFTSFYTSR